MESRCIGLLVFTALVLTSSATMGSKRGWEALRQYSSIVSVRVTRCEETTGILYLPITQDLALGLCPSLTHQRPSRPPLTPDIFPNLPYIMITVIPLCPVADCWKATTADARYNLSADVGHRSPGIALRSIQRCTGIRVDAGA